MVEHHLLNRRLIGSAIILLSGIFSLNIHAQSNSEKAIGVFVTDVQQGQFADTVEALGTLQARDNVALAATVTELITEIHFSDGQRVAKGDLLVKMDDSEQQAMLAEEKARLIEAQQNVERLKPLANRGAASKAALDQNQALLAAAEARIKAIEARIKQRAVVAPFSGVVGLRNISVGSLAQPGTVVTTIDDDSVMKLDFSVPELFVGQIKIGNEISATADAYKDTVYQGRIASIDSRIDPVTRSITVRALLDNAESSLKPGMLMRVSLSKNPRQALVLQEEAVFAEGRKKFVYAVAESDKGLIAQKREVSLGQRREGEAEIIGGLKAGERVVVHGIQRLRDGRLISILAKEQDNETLKELLKSKVASK